MQIIQGIFYGRGAAVTIQLGSIPYQVRIYNLDGATPDELIWDRGMQADVATAEGISRVGAGSAVTDEVFGAGITPYYGGELLTTTNQPSVAYGNAAANYLERDDTDYRYYTDSAAGISGDAATVTIDTWTLDTAATPTGSFNGDVTGSYIGPGSLIRIVDTVNKGSGKNTYEAYITALTAGQGVTADEVTLSWAVPSGRIDFIGGKYGYIESTVGTVTKPGFTVNMATPINVATEMHCFTALCP